MELPELTIFPKSGTCIERGREINYSIEGYFDKWELKWRATATDTATGIQESARGYKSADGAKEHAIRDLFERLPTQAPKSSESHDSQQEAFIKAMSEGGGNLSQSNIVMHGPPGAGKTSLKRVILGQPPLPKEEQNSTNIIENAVRAVRIERLKQFEEVDNEKMIVNLARAVQELATNKHPKVQPIQRPQITSSAALFLYDDEDLPDIPISDNLSQSTALHSINKKLKNVTPSSEMFDSQWYHLIDSGGQPQFYDILPLVYRSPSLNLVVIRLMEELDDRPKVTFHCQGRDDYELPDKLLLTNRQFIVRMCQTAANCGKSGGPVSYVMVVGTHKDILDTEGEEASKSKIKKLNDELKSELKEFEELGVLICKSDDEIIFDIDAMATGEKRQQYTKDMQQTISDIVEENSVPQPVPLKWFAFQLELAKSEGVVRMEKCYEVGQELEMNEADVKNALVYFSRAALLMYFPDDIPDLVLTKVDPLIDRLSLLVKASFKTPKPTLCAQCKKLREKGLFEKNFLVKVLANGKVSSGDLQNDEFLKLLESLKIAVHNEGEEYFLPSALSFEPPSENCELNQSPVSLAFCWDECFLPHGFFFTVAIELLNRSDEAGDSIFILRTDQQVFVQCREEIQVSGKQGKIPGVVKLMDRKQWIQVSYFTYFGVEKYCPVIHNAVDTAIHRAVDRFQHTGLDYPSVRYLCPLHSDQEDHYCYLSDDQQIITCSLNNRKTGRKTSEMLYWVPKHKGTVQKCKPDLKDVHNLLKQKSSKWDEIGGGLEVCYNFRQCQESLTTSAQQKLEAVLNKWIESECSEVSWNHLTQVLKDMGLVDVAEKVRRYLQTDLSAIRKYDWL